MATSSANDLHLVPLGAGDLIDRAVRLYRRHLFTLMRIAAPPVVVSAIGWVMWTIGWRQVFTTPDTATLLFYVLLIIVAITLVAGGHILSLIVMGGASRNLVTHLLWGEPVLARTTYAAVRSRFFSLLGATLLVVLWLGLAMMVASTAGYFIGIFLVIAVALLMQVLPVWVSVIVGIVGGLAALAVSLWLFFFMAGKVAYVPQVLLVEGKGVFDSISRSFSLAKGNWRRLMAMTFFITFATYSALMILVVPLWVYGYLNGVSTEPWSSTQPVWYAIGYSVLEPLSSILLAPVWMLGMSLLYVDERVRHEGYDIELMASQKLDPMPQIDVTSPFAPAISIVPNRLPLQRPIPSGSVLGLR
jgi:type III secretory pathway component EscS